MNAQAPQKDQANDQARLPPKLATKLLVYASIAALVGVAWAVAAAAQDTTRFAHAYLVGFLFVAAVALGALFFALIQFVARAGTSIASRRHAEWLASAMPVVAALFLPLIPWGPLVWSRWMGPDATEALGHGKALFLNPNFFYLRAALYLVVWMLLARRLVKRSAAQDVTGEAKLTEKLQAFSAPALVLFAVTVTFASFDWLMSLDPAWYSTIFGVYVFSGAAVSGMAAIALIQIALQRGGLLTQVSRVEHRHDIGKWVFAFTVFYAYIAFCQYFLIWYANIPEETIFYLERWEGGWRGVTWLLIATRFVIPFLLLLSRTGKRAALPLALASVCVLVGQYVDLAWIVLPKLHPHGLRFGWIEMGALAGPLSLFTLWVVWRAAKGNLYPLRDPRLVEALRFENG